MLEGFLYLYPEDGLITSKYHPLVEIELRHNIIFRCLLDGEVFRFAEWMKQNLGRMKKGLKLLLVVDSITKDLRSPFLLQEIFAKHHLMILEQIITIDIFE